MSAFIGGDERFIEFAGLRPHRDLSLDARRRFHREAEVLEHQGRGEPALIIIVGGCRRPDSREPYLACTLARRRPI